MSTKKKLQPKELKSIEGTTEFKPTLLMASFVETAVRLGSDNVAEICREAKMTEQAYYVWKKDPNFDDWMNKYANQLIRGDAWKLQNIGMRKARNDHRYWESMQKIVGNITDSTQTNVQVNILNSLKDDKEKYKL